ncbi:MAG: cadherin-like beta sandwich domain-containing protein [Lachnospiraceae bacterium]|nr:cadherin-like beta sandwich domain-containing protein [Lachnospiraceae bacterium]
MKTKMTSARICTSSGRRNASVAVLKLLYPIMKIKAFLLSGMTGIGKGFWRQLVLLTVCVVMMAAAGGMPVFASSCNIVFSASEQEIMVEDTVTVELTIEGDVVPGIFEGYVSYDSDVIEYVSGPECIAGGEGTLRISDMGYESSTLTRKYTLEFKGVKMGSSEISMRGTPEIYEADLGYLMSVSANKISISVKASKQASSDATLGLLRINPGELKPSFSSDKYEYTVQVPFEVTEIYVSAAPNNAQTEVKIEGNTNLSVGQNRVLILTTAEDGTKSKYVIYVARAQQDENAENAGTENPDGNNGDQAGENGNGSNGETDGNGQTSDDDTESIAGWSFYAEEKNGTVFISANSRFRVSRNPQNVIIPDGYNKTSIMISGQTVTAYAPSTNPGSDYLLLVLEKDGSLPALYSFDRVEKTLQRLNEERIVAGNKTGSGYSTIEEEELVKSYEKSLGTMTMVIAILSGVCMLLLIIVIKMALRNRNELD